MGLFGGIGGIGDLFKNIPGLNMLSTAMDLVQGVMSGDLNKILSSVSQLALTYATGGAGALLGQLAPVVQNVGSDLMAKVLTNAMSVESALATIQMIGTEMGLGQNDIDAAQGAFAEAVGEKDLARTNYREAGFNDKGTDGDRRSFFGGYRGNSVTDAEKGGARELLGGILAGPNPTQVGIGQAQQQANTLLGALMNAMISSVFGSLLGGGAENVAGNGTTNVGEGTKTPSGKDDAFDDVFDMQTKKNEDDRKKKENGKELAPGEQAAQIAAELGVSTGGFLMQFALVLGEALDKKTDEMLKVAKAMNQQTGEFAKLTDQVEGDENAAADRQNKITEGNSRLQTLGAILNGTSKEMEALQNALKTALDSIGQAQSAMARRQ